MYGDRIYNTIVRELFSSEDYYIQDRWRLEEYLFYEDETGLR